MPAENKLGRATTQRLALLKNQASYVFWYGKIETTVDRAKEVSRYVEKLLTLAINTYTDTIVVTKEVIENGKTVKREMYNDGVKKLNARRKLMANLYAIPEVQQIGEKTAAFRARTSEIKNPLIEKIFNEYAPKYAKRAEELKQGGGYTRILKTSVRKGDAAQMAIIELI